VVRALTFDPSGKAITTNIADAWVVRSNSYPARVAPVADNPEMIIIRPDPADLVLPAGRTLWCSKVLLMISLSTGRLLT